jgi:hypothetical protein
MSRKGGGSSALEEQRNQFREWAHRMERNRTLAFTVPGRTPSGAHMILQGVTFPDFVVHKRILGTFLVTTNRALTVTSE